MPLSAVPEVQTVTIHGHRRAFVRVGRGPAVVLLHGVGHDHRTWLPVLRPLSRHFTVIAPDLLGHGSSDAPRADYSIGGYANGVRDLLAINGIQSATVIGNSLGGGIAMQFAYQFPQWTERLVLVGSGGLGRSVSPLLRALTMPGGNVALKTVTLPPVRIPAAALMRRLHDAGIRGTTDFKGLAEVYDALGNTPRRRAFHHVLQAAVDWRGQVITMLDRAYLAESMPCMVIWGEQDSVIPVKHAYAAHAVLPGSQLEVIPHAGHFPQEDDPEHFASAVIDFILDTKPAKYEGRKWARALAEGPRPRKFWARQRPPQVDSELG
ncbi:MAG: alpha/beta fold hydrolase [Candidatus Nanopelagicales bacterium]